MFKVNTYKDELPVGPAFYIASKGEHAGQPSKEPWVNCFVITSDDEKLNNSYLYYVALALFHQGKYKPYLKGSVIPFITARDVREVIDEGILYISLRDVARADKLFAVIEFSKELKIRESTVKAVEKAAFMYLTGLLKR